ncbi:hypothetical protein HOY80DRAFT_1047829 [Tuber brumale]|nr:hypothetical protein HOY80DRAFT_1047829 [Tuber brumale]
MSENQPDPAHKSFAIASAEFTNVSSTCWTVGKEEGRGILSGQSPTTEAEGDEFRDGSTTRGSESGVDGHEESVANLFEEDEILDDLAKLATFQRSYHRFPKTSDKDTMEDLLLTITDPEVVESVKLVASNEPSKSSRSVVSGDLSERLAKRQKDKLDRAAVNEKSKATRVSATDPLKEKRLVDRLHSALVNAPDSWLPAQRKVTGSQLVSGEPIEGLDELKPSHLSVVEVLKCTAAFRLGLELMSPPEIRRERKEKPARKDSMLRHKERKRSVRKKAPGRTMRDEGAHDGMVMMARCSDQLRNRIAGKPVLGEDKKVESQGDVEANDFFNEDQRQAMQCCSADPEQEPNGNDPAKGQYKKSTLVDHRFIRNAEAAPRRPDRTKLIDERRKKVEARQPKPKRSGCRDAEYSRDDEVGKVSPEEDQVTIVNNASSNMPTNPFSQLRVSPRISATPRTKTCEKGSTSSRPLPGWWSAGDTSTCLKVAQDRNDSGGEEGNDGDERATNLVLNDRRVGVNIDQQDDVFTRWQLATLSQNSWRTKETSTRRHQAMDPRILR